MTKPRPKTGEPRQTRQPLKIDKLPVELRDELRVLREQGGKTWDEIEDLSPKLAGWQKANDEAKALFPEQRIPRENLRRWYDLRIEQLRADAVDRSSRVREIVADLAQRGVTGLNEAVTTAITEQVFSLTEAADAQNATAYRKSLIEFGWLLAQQRRLDIQQQKVDVEKEKLVLIATKIKGLKKDVEKHKLSPVEMQQRLDEIYGITA